MALQKFVMIAFFIFLLCAQKTCPSKVESNYSESIQLEIDVDPSKMSYRTTLRFSFDGLGRPYNLYDFRNKPSFLSLSIIAQYLPNGEVQFSFTYI
ncbi:hypothetical protein KEJ33_05685 [Candidatus Bathyarchaeota archaeon]|nr:hypothetical protein [Candidatus Bathyarchaeota archaeon]